MSNVTATRVNERTDTGFGLLKGVEQSHPRKHGKAKPRKGAPLHRPAQSKAEVFCLPCWPIIPAISPEILMAGCGPTLKTSARGDSSPDARLPVRICTTPLLPGSFPAKLTSNQYRVESPARSEPTTARRSFPTPALPVPSKEAH